MRTTLPLFALASLACACAPGGKTTMPAPEHLHHHIDYVELGVPDLVEGKRFYREAFGWEFNDYGPTYAGIRRGSDPGAEVGGLRVDEAVVRGGPLIILYSADLEQSVEQVRAAGGTITREIFDFPGGRRFHFTDPAGNELAVWSEARLAR